jgi:hypothetical protein
MRADTRREEVKEPGTAAPPAVFIRFVNCCELFKLSELLLSPDVYLLCSRSSFAIEHTCQLRWWRGLGRWVGFVFFLELHKF